MYDKYFLCIAYFDRLWSHLLISRIKTIIKKHLLTPLLALCPVSRAEHTHTKKRPLCEVVVKCVCVLCRGQDSSISPLDNFSRNMDNSFGRSSEAKLICLKSLSSAFLISRYILWLGQEAQKQQCPPCPNPKMILEIRRADEWLFRLL